MQPLKTGTRESELAVWQAKQVQALLKQDSVESELVFINSEGDVDLVTPLYQMGVQGIFTKTLDAALLNKRIDIAVHSMKDVPTQLPRGIRQAAVLQRGSYKDLLVFKEELSLIREELGSVNGQRSMSNGTPLTIATSSIRRRAQWLHRYSNHTIENLRGNINTRLRKLKDSNWNGAIFAAAGLERINLRPQNSIELDWMLPAPAQGAIMVVCRENDENTFNICQAFNHKVTEQCTKIERDFLSKLMGGCSTSVSALAEVLNDKIIFKGNICSADGRQKIDINKEAAMEDGNETGIAAAEELLTQPDARAIVHEMLHAKK
jgi:hydroxymethylbilane synthase